MNDHFIDAFYSELEKLAKEEDKGLITFGKPTKAEKIALVGLAGVGTGLALLSKADRRSDNAESAQNIRSQRGSDDRSAARSRRANAQTAGRNITEKQATKPAVSRMKYRAMGRHKFNLKTMLRRKR